MLCPRSAERAVRVALQPGISEAARRQEPLTPRALILAALLLSACASGRQDRAAARTLAEMRESIAKLPACDQTTLEAALPGVAADAPVSTNVIARGQIRIGLEDGRYAHCLGDEETGCAPLTGPWVFRPAAGGPEVFALYAAETDEMGWVSREGEVITLTGLWLGEVIVTGTLGGPLRPEDRARQQLRHITFRTMCRPPS
jgi:hypothetical protein